LNFLFDEFKNQTIFFFHPNLFVVTISQGLKIE